MTNWLQFDLVIFLTQKEEFDFFSPPCVRKVPKELKTDGDARRCAICHANTVYGNTPCAVCGIKTDNQRLRFSGKQS